MRAMATADDDAHLILVTTPDLDVGRRLARGLVDARLAACVNVLPGVTSIYRWQGAVEESSEVLLVAKTSRARLADCEAFVRREHPYDTPEFVALAARHVEPRYAAWLAESVR